MERSDLAREVPPLIERSLHNPLIILTVFLAMYWLVLTVLDWYFSGES